MLFQFDEISYHLASNLTLPDILDGECEVIADPADPDHFLIEDIRLRTHDSKAARWGLAALSENHPMWAGVVAGIRAECSGQIREQLDALRPYRDPNDEHRLSKAQRGLAA